MSEMSYDSDMFESSSHSKRQPSNAASSVPRKSIMKPKKNLDEIWLEEKFSSSIRQKSLSKILRRPRHGHKIFYTK